MMDLHTIDWHGLKLWAISRLRLLALLWLACWADWSKYMALWWIATGRDAQAREVIMAYDRLGNAGTGGSSRESISYRAGRGRREGLRRWCLLCRVLDAAERDHCQKAQP